MTAHLLQRHRGPAHLDTYGHSLGAHGHRLGAHGYSLGAHGYSLYYTHRVAGSIIGGRPTTANTARCARIRGRSSNGEEIAACAASAARVLPSPRPTPMSARPESATIERTWVLRVAARGASWVAACVHGVARCCRPREARVRPFWRAHVCKVNVDEAGLGDDVGETDDALAQHLPRGEGEGGGLGLGRGLARGRGVEVRGRNTQSV